jgi:dihydropteroate synthase
MLSINCKGRLVVFDRPKIMGIINITPDSFYKGSRNEGKDETLQRVQEMLAAGASFIDIGGQSTRPGSERISAAEESDRVLPIIESLVKEFPDILISIDTFYAEVAKASVRAGAAVVNDISAGSFDLGLIEMVAELKVPYVLTHIKGTPATMQQMAVYQNVVTEVFDFLNAKINELHAKGIKDIIADPGFGFAKTSTHNFELLSAQSYFRKLGVPLLTGISRKATIYKTLGITAEEALNGTTVLNTIALLQGVQLLRVHDIREANQAIQLIEAYKEKEQFAALS